MKPCLNPSLVRTRDLEAYLDIAAQAGYTAVEADVGAVVALVRAQGMRAVRKLFRDRGIELGSFGLPVDVHAEEAVFRAGLERLPEAAAVAAELGARSACTWLWPSVDELPVPYASRLAVRFRRCAEVLAACGLRLGLEFVGPHHLRGRAYPFVYTMADTLAYIDGIGAPNIGLLLDSYHWYTTEATAEDIRRIPVHRIAHVHVNDTDRPPAEAVDNERLLPGEGRIPLAAFFTALADIGYAGPVSIEVLRKEPFAEPDLEVARRALAGLRRVLAAV
ncbi:sugar phosphate isomerase/epimerase family protein [Alicyclobacillus cellulosilyticus]|uniref:sugar phosphate isomerase/epimerase family protein n=1 Tax=Alicyclobacillus cellulosilyticus TaxID=1003997 RepID=UPI00166ADB7A|nr:sugar phosphate isomerase/epimerase family protein [Alicyclobacillus cellulosilyticus]